MSHHVCGIIVASLLAKNSNTFRPLKQIGGKPLVRRLAETMLDTGVDPVCVLTGYRGAEVRSSLEGLSTVFLEDPFYEKRDMLLSVQPALKQYLDSCDVFLIAPVGIQPFSRAAVSELLRNDAAVAVPVSGGVNGHPLKIDRRAAAYLSEYRGQDGLKGGLCAMGAETRYIPVSEDDRGGGIRPEARILLSGEDVFFGPEQRGLLLAVKSKGSVRAASDAVGVSYSKARNMIRRMEKELGFMLVERTQGGVSGGCSRLTESGERFLEIFAGYEQAVSDYAGEVFDSCFQEMRESL
ncbi:MAG: NTP transferase domain-containing protein [Clostridia bacterium]|nr:NTP transferase domain-containing protein [Clostridia bacterium]